jgi:hypothetical protein
MCCKKHPSSKRQRKPLAGESLQVVIPLTNKLLVCNSTVIKKIKVSQLRFLRLKYSVRTVIYEETTTG